jgi:type IV pilus assembly protein PilM
MALALTKLFSKFTVSTPSHPNKVVGIDFGSSSLKVAEIELRDDVLTLSTYGELQLGPYAGATLGSGVKLDSEKSVEAIVDILRESGVESKSSVFALPLAGSFVTVMSLPFNKDENIATRVPVEARKYIPVPLTDVTLEWTELPYLGEGEQLTRDILLVAIQNDTLGVMRETLKAVQLVDQPLEIELFSTLRAAARQGDTSLAVIDMGASMCKLYISDNGYLRKIHRIPIGGITATETIAKTANITFEEAENRKRNYMAQQNTEIDIKPIVTSVFDRPFQEFKRVISMHETRTGTHINRVVLTGGSALFHDFSSYASYVLDREATLGNPFTKVAYPAFMEDKLKEIGPIFATAVGAALRTFEL